MMSRLEWLFGLSLILGSVSTSPARAAAPLETETARFFRRGMFEAEGSLELQRSKDGRESAVPLAFEYGLADRLALMVEPVPFTRITPKNGGGTRGTGDVEVTLSGLLLSESGRRPAFALAGEIKLPTAESRLIGSDRADYSAYAIASKQFGKLDAHANLGFTVVGHPAGVPVNNTINYAVAGEYEIRPTWTLVGEVLGNTAALSEGKSSGESAVAPEISGGETIAMVGARWIVMPRLTASFGVTVDNTGAVLIRPGLATRF
jgi:Putative MetA-pathway of phenol degradation